MRERSTYPKPFKAQVVAALPKSASNHAAGICSIKGCASTAIPHPHANAQPCANHSLEHCHKKHCFQPLRLQNH
jgi:hypothetical protein